MFDNMKRADKEGAMNPIYIMADFRRSRFQTADPPALRHARPHGQALRRNHRDPITANFREGLTVLEYFISTHGARKGLGRYRPQNR